MPFQTAQLTSMQRMLVPQGPNTEIQVTTEQVVGRRLASDAHNFRTMETSRERIENPVDRRVLEATMQ